MQYVTMGMILVGSALMVYNIIRYGMFIKRNADLERKSASKGTTYVPLFLLIFFLVGYIGVALSGIANILIASILFGGSVFVFLLLWVMFSIINHILNTEKVLAARYEDTRRRMEVMTKDSIAVLLVNLTKDEIEEQKGDFFGDPDLYYASYSELYAAGDKYFVESAGDAAVKERFSREGLLRTYQEGMTHVSEVLLVRRNDNSVGFVNFEATLTTMPVSGDVVAFLVEKQYNEEIVRRTLLRKVLMDQYDRVAYIINGHYKDLITNSGKKRGLLLNVEEEDTYESIYLNFFLPAMDYDPANNGGEPNPLRLSVIEKELASKEFYEVDAPFMIDGARHYKHFVFYKINEEARFYLMLISDSTRMREEQEARNRELSEALADAVRSNEARIRFFTGVSHGLRTPMNGILGFTELASQEKDVEKLRSYIAKIDVSGKRLLSAVNDLFAMSLIESGKLELENEPVDLSVLSSQIVSRVCYAHPEITAEVVAEAEDVRGERVLCDPARLSQILERLLENSIAFAPEHTRVTLSVSKNDAGYLFCVKNNCDKVSPEIAEKLFEQEMWEANDEALSVAGAGIGMTVAKTLIDRMGGSADIIAGDDTMTIEITLPLEKAQEEKTSDNGVKDFGPLSLLVVDDNEINREIAKLMLSGEGHEVDLATDGADAVEKVKASGGKYDVVFMDVQMPVMNGYEATAAIRALDDPALSSIPIIAMTANAYQEDQNDALNAGMNGYVPKPINPDDILAALKKVFAK